MTDRYFLTEEREVTKAEYVAAERRAGFRNSMGQRDEPATASFSTGTFSGRIQYGYDKPVLLDVSRDPQQHPRDDDGRYIEPTGEDR